MTKSLKAGLASLLLLAGGAAMAGDLPTRKGVLPPAPVLPELFSWTGFYAGGQIGYSWGSDRTRFTVLGGALAGVAFDYAADGVVGGGHAGFNYQIGGFVLGIEGDVEGLDAKGGFNSALAIGRVSRDWQASIRGRVGFALDRFMIYGTGGAAFTEYSYRLTNPATGVSESAEASRGGWTAGGGVSYALTDHLIGGVEYRYTDFGRASRVARSAFAGLASEQETTSHTVRTSLGYKF